MFGRQGLLDSDLVELLRDTFDRPCPREKVEIFYFTQEMFSCAFFAKNSLCHVDKNLT